MILDWILDQLLRTFNYGLRLLLLFSPSSEYSGLISFRIGWFDLLAIQGTLKQHHSLKASVLCHSAFFTVQLSHLYRLYVRYNFYLMAMLNSMWMLPFPHYYGGIGKWPPWLGFYFPTLLNLFMVISWFLLVEYRHNDVGMLSEIIFHFSQWNREDQEVGRDGRVTDEMAPSNWIIIKRKSTHKAQYMLWTVRLTGKNIGIH